MPVIIDGTNGVSTPNTFAFKNRLINAQLLINQRGVSGTVSLSAGAYGHDRFKAGASGCTYTFSTTNNVTTLTISAGSLQQVIEGLNLESGTYTLSWTGTAQGKIGAGSYGASGITGSITGGTNTTIEFNTGTLSLPQLEVGSTATSFDYRPYGTELALCQRYTYRHSAEGDIDNFAPLGMGRYFGTNAAQLYVPFKVTMRTSPSSVTQVGNIAVNDVAFNAFAITLALNETSSSGATLTGTTTSGTTAGNATTFYANGTSNAALIFSAEL